jgi:ribonucleotide reductase beta subunit family protein with ferritin-like domain
MTKFTKEMSVAVHQVKPPYPKLVVDFVEFDQYIGIRVYENQIMEMNAPQMETFMEYLQMIRKLIESFGVKCYFDGAKGDPPRGTR